MLYFLWGWPDQSLANRRCSLTHKPLDASESAEPARAGVWCAPNWRSFALILSEPKSSTFSFGADFKSMEAACHDSTTPPQVATRGRPGRPSFKRSTKRLSGPSFNPGQTLPFEPDHLGIFLDPFAISSFWPKTESVQFLQSPHVDSFQYSHRRSDTEKCRDFYWKWTSVALVVSSQWWYSRNPNCKCGDFLTQVWCYVHSSCLCIVNVNLVSSISSSSFSFVVSFGELLKAFCLMRPCL